MNITPALKCFTKENLINGFTRPYIKPNAWIASIEDEKPSVTLKWDEKQSIKSLTLYFDTDFDHPMESTQMGHPENVITFCIRNYKIKNENGEILIDQQ